MKILRLGKLPGTSTWKWRTDNNTGLYYTFSDGTGIHFLSDHHNFHHKVATCEKFKACKSVSGTRKKLNRIFKDIPSDPTRKNQWKL